MLAVNGEMTFTASIAIRIDERQTTSKIMRGLEGYRGTLRVSHSGKGYATPSPLVES